MVRKRSRTTKTRRNSKKNYESDDNDSDIDLDLNSPPSSPARKRYGLRQRKQPVFFAHYDYDDDDDKNPQKTCSDEEYNIEVELNSEQTNQCKKSSKSEEKCNNSTESSSYYNDRESEEISMENGLIDFEDVIRADVVVNKQRVDYDNMIMKTAIQIHDTNKPIAPVKEKGRKGRKPKRELHENRISISSNIEGINSIKNCHEDETNLEVQIDPSILVQSDSDEIDTPYKSNGIASKRNFNNCHQGPPVKNISENGGNLCSWVDKIEKYIPPELDEKEKQVMLSNEYLLANTFDVTVDEFLQKQIERENEPHEEIVDENILFVNFDDDDSSNDVVIIEKKPEIIILDDD